MNARVLFATESLIPGNGGIAQMARLIARVIGEEHQSGRMCAEGIVLSDPNACPDFGFPIPTAYQSRLHFILTTHRAALSRTHFIYDFLGMARAHCRVPLLRRPFMVWLAGIEIWEGAPRKRVATAQRATFPIAISAYTRDRAEKAHGRFPRLRVCWLGTDTDDAPVSSPATTGPPTVLMVGRLLRARDKGHDALITCWPKVVSAVPGCKLVIVGTGPDLDSFRRQAAASSAASLIDFLGFVPPEKMSEVWAQATLFAMPSRGEGFGFVYIEAMRYGLPVIASIHDAASEINIDGVTGYNISLDAPNDLVDRLIFLLETPDHAASLGANARDRWSKFFRYSAFKARFTPLLYEFLDYKM